MKKRFCVAIRKILPVYVMLACGFLFSSCGKKDKLDGKVSVEDLTSETSISDNRLVEHIFDGTKPDRGKVFKITVDVYEAPVLTLGESYHSVKLLEEKSARPIAKLTNLVNSGETAEFLDEVDQCSLNTGVLLAENGQFIDVQVELSLKEFEMSFSTLIKFNYPAFYEVNVSGQPDKVHVLVLNGFEQPKL